MRLGRIVGCGATFLGIFGVDLQGRCVFDPRFDCGRGGFWPYLVFRVARVGWFGVGG